MPFQHLSDTTVAAVIAGVIQVDLADDAGRAALADGVSKTFTLQVMPTSGSNLMKLTGFVHRLNETEVLVGGQVPMAIWLRNAIQYSAGRPAELVFREALAEMSVDGATSSATTTVTRAPVPRPGPSDALTLRCQTGQGLEIAIGRDDTLGVEFLIAGATASRSVAKIEVHRHFGGVPRMLPGGHPNVLPASCWVIGPGLVVTNYHVLAARLPGEAAPTSEDLSAQGATAKVTFDYVLGHDTPITVGTQRAVVCDPALDYAILRLAEVLPDRQPLRLLTTPMHRTIDEPLRERVNILQHPDGQRMRLGFRDNFVVTADGASISYLTDTAGGSSGSPILDDAWWVAGLHRGWRTIQGSTIELWGEPVHQENHGTPIAAILADVAVRDPALHAEIVAGQQSLAPAPA